MRFVTAVFYVMALLPCSLRAEEMTNETLQSMLSVQQAQIKALTDRLTALEGAALKKSDASATYLTKTAANDRFPTKAMVKNCEMTFGVAKGTEAKVPEIQHVDNGTDQELETFWYNYPNSPVRVFMGWYCNF